MTYFNLYAKIIVNYIRYWGDFMGVVLWFLLIIGGMATFTFLNLVISEENRYTEKYIQFTNDGYYTVRLVIFGLVFVFSSAIIHLNFGGNQILNTCLVIMAIIGYSLIIYSVTFDIATKKQLKHIKKKFKNQQQLKPLVNFYLMVLVLYRADVANSFWTTTKEDTSTYYELLDKLTELLFLLNNQKSLEELFIKNNQEVISQLDKLITDLTVTQISPKYVKQYKEIVTEETVDLFTKLIVLAHNDLLSDSQNPSKQLINELEAKIIQYNKLNS